MIRLDVQAERGAYPVVIGAGVLSQLDRIAAEAHPALSLRENALVVSCTPVWRRHGRRLRGFMGTAKPALIPDGERAKTLATVARIYDALIGRQADRGATLVAFGGGVVGDVAGFAAASYLRGIPLLQVPTTLLAQVDSAIGGKVGVNLKAGKNLVGAFHPPGLVACDPEVLGTLPRREFRSGLYEVVKYGVIASRPLLDRVAADLPAILAKDPGTLTPIIADCCRIKADIVSRDEREGGPRRALNFGHTAGHALEAITKYRRFRHGEAVALGMLVAADISVTRGLLSREAEAQLKDLIQRLGTLPRVSDLKVSDALAAIAHDKKIVRGKLHFVLACGLGATGIVDDVTTDEIGAALKRAGLK